MPTLERAFRRFNSTVLVVDDDEVLRRYMTRVLEDEGYRVLLAEDGHDPLPPFTRHCDLGRRK